MTDKQRLFVEAYLASAPRFNATSAARTAGYADPEMDGWRVRQDPEVQAEINGRIEQYAMSADEVLSRLASQARGTIAEFVDPSHWGGKPEITLSAGKLKKSGHLIKKFKSGKAGTEIELYDAQAALIALGKAHGLFIDRTRLEGELTVKRGPDLSKLSDEELDQLEQLIGKASESGGDSGGAGAETAGEDLDAI